MLNCPFPVTCNLAIISPSSWLIIGTSKLRLRGPRSRTGTRSGIDGGLRNATQGPRAVEHHRRPFSATQRPFSYLMTTVRNRLILMLAITTSVSKALVDQSTQQRWSATIPRALSRPSDDAAPSVRLLSRPAVRMKRAGRYGDERRRVANTRWHQCAGPAAESPRRPQALRRAMHR